MKTKVIYEWDTSNQRSFSFEESKLLGDISEMLRRGCKIKELNEKMKVLNL
jgi:hypothetical protein